MIKILIAEDDPMMARLYQKVFTFEGYEVQMAVNGQDALDQARSFSPTLIVLDVMMPKLNGLQALGQIKADPKLKTIPVVMLTNLAGQQDAESALAQGAAKYVIKSEHEPKEVAGIVKEVLDAQQPPAAATPTTPPATPPTTPPVA
jgi:two-component system cell cycle response regulator DivK